MRRPVLDPRNIEDLRREVARLARAYTPEWRFERSGDDPGAALAELFCTMFHESVERLNAMPWKLYYEFLNQIGFRELPPVPASGVMLFSPSDTVEEPVTVPMGTQVFTPDEEGENVVYETQWTIQATPARLLDVYFTDPASDRIDLLDPNLPMPFFTPSGTPLQRHRMELGQERALRLDCPASITLEFLDEAGRPAPGCVKALSDGDLRWSYRHGGEWLPFDDVRLEDAALTLEKRTSLPLEANGEGRLTIRCAGSPRQTLRLERLLISSAPLAPCPAQSLFSGDTPIGPEAGGLCFGRQIAPYSLFCLRSDTVLSKRGARVKLTLALTPVVWEPDPAGDGIRYDRHIIDKQDVTAEKPDEAFVSGVLWEYFNGLGWRRLEVSGDKNPFSCRKSGPFHTFFTVPEDLEPTEVNAEEGFYIRARVTEVENRFSRFARWILPFAKGADFQWRYEEGVQPDWIRVENHGASTEIPDAGRRDRLGLTALDPMPPGPQAMYFRFDRSPHASPLSLRFEITGGKGLDESPHWERWDGRQFTPFPCIDQTGRLGRSGCLQLFLNEPLPRTDFFGRNGCWLRLRRFSAQTGLSPVAGGIQPNAVTAVQCQREPEQFFDTGVYEAGKTVRLLSGPVQNCRVWVDERLSAAELETFGRECPERLQLEWEGQELAHCWVRWEPVEDLLLAGDTARVYALDPYERTISFGDGRHGRVPPAGNRGIRVQYASGGGPRGNQPSVNALLGGLPLIADVRNVTPMSGGTGGMAREWIETRGNRILRTRGRAAGCRDYEDLVLQAFSQVRHVRCFSGVDEAGRRAPGHVTVVLRGFGADEETGELCGRVRDYLGKRCSCCLMEEGRLHVRPAVVLTIHTQTTVTVERPELAADTQREISRRLRQCVQETWQPRPIGEQIRLDEIWQTVRQTPNVGAITRILAEAAFRQDGADRLAPLEEDVRFPFGVVESGVHRVRIR